MDKKDALLEHEVEEQVSLKCEYDARKISLPNMSISCRLEGG